VHSPKIPFTDSLASVSTADKDLQYLVLSNSLLHLSLQRGLYLPYPSPITSLSHAWCKFSPLLWSWKRSWQSWMVGQCLPTTTESSHFVSWGLAFWLSHISSYWSQSNLYWLRSLYYDCPLLSARGSLLHVRGRLEMASACFLRMLAADCGRDRGPQKQWFGSFRRQINI
jgi:hypothetical protein